MTDPAPLDVLRSSVERLGALVDSLPPGHLVEPAYPSEWTVADTLSHIGSGAVIMRRRLEDGFAGRDTDDGFAPSVWDEWNAKAPVDQAVGAIVADAGLLAALDAATAEEREGFSFSMGPMAFDFDGIIGLRLNEHVLHTWDVAVSIDPTATIDAEAVGLIVDRLELIARFSGRPGDVARTVVVRTSEPERHVAVVIGTDSVQLEPADPGQPADVELPAEELIRLVYGRLDPADSTVADREPLDLLRATFPGP